MKNPNLKTLCTLSVLLLVFVAAKGQSIWLTNKSAGRQINIRQGMRISYALKDSHVVVVGMLQQITPDNITVDGVKVAIKDLRTIGKRKNGSGAGAALLTALGLASITAAVVGDQTDPCPQCSTQVSDRDAGGTALGFLSGAAFLAFGAHVGFNNSARNLDKWTLTVKE